MNLHRWFIAIFIILIIIFGLGFVKFNQIQAAIAFGESFPEPSASVKSTYVTTVQHTKNTRVIGQLQAPKTVTIRNEYPGSITLVNFKPGDVVTKDQVLLTIDSRLDKANLAAAKARLKLAESTYARTVKLRKQGRISQDEVDKAEADAAIAQAEVDSLATVISKKTIRAPFDGNVGLTQYQVGELLNANTSITSLVGIDETIWVDFSVPQTLQQLDIGDTVEVVSVGLNTIGHETFVGRIIAKDPSMDIHSRQQGYRAALSNEERVLSHHQMVTVIVPMQRSQAVIVPTNAITRSHFGEFVYRLEKDEAKDWRAKPVQVTLGEKIQDQQIVLSGLQAGDFIATEGAFKLKENMLVYTSTPSDEQQRLEQERPEQEITQSSELAAIGSK